jgi:hypothetical protein
MQHDCALVSALGGHGPRFAPQPPPFARVCRPNPTSSPRSPAPSPAPPTPLHARRVGIGSWGGLQVAREVSGTEAEAEAAEREGEALELAAKALVGEAACGMNEMK